MRSRHLARLPRLALVVSLLALVALSCSEAKQTAKEARETAAAGVDKAKAGAEAARAGAEAARAGAAAAGAYVFDGAVVALKAKRELDRIYKTTKDYDLDIASETGDDAAMRAHEAQIAAMPHATVNGVTVGYEEDASRSLRGTSYSRHFRAIWVVKGRKVAVSYYTREELDAVAFAELLGKLVPVVQGAME